MTSDTDFTEQRVRQSQSEAARDRRDAIPVARQLARAALAVSVKDLPSIVVEKTRVLLLDCLACIFEATPLPWSRQAMAAITPAATGATVIGTALHAGPSDAAFVNATMAHGLVREDMHAGSIGHHGVVVLPAVLAEAETGRFSGEAFLAAVAVGYETGARIGRALFTSDLARLFRPTGILGPLGAALAVSHLLQLDEAAAARAIGLAANTSSGLNQWPQGGGSEMYFHAGFAARNGLTCARLAAAGAFGSEDIIEGSAGLFAAFARRGLATPIALFENGSFEIMSVYCKPAPACNFAQTACQAALDAIRHLGADSSLIERIAIRVTEAAYLYPGCNAASRFDNVLQAKMSIQFGVASVLAKGTLEAPNYERLDDPEILRLVAVTDLEPDPDFTRAFPATQGASVDLMLKNGSRVSRSLQDVVPATAAEVRARFRAAASAKLGPARADAIEDFIDDIGNKDDVGRLGALCALT